MNVFRREGKFFFGPVLFEAQGLFRSTYSLPACGSVVKIKLGGHIRLIRGREIPPFPFDVVAPIGDVKVISGSIPDAYVRTMHGHEYLKIQQEYQRF